MPGPVNQDELLGFAQQVPERKGPCVPRVFLILPPVEQQVRRDFDFLDETLGTNDYCDFRVQHLDRNGPVVLAIVRKIDGGHAATAEFTLNCVFVGEGLGYAFDVTGHDER